MMEKLTVKKSSLKELTEALQKAVNVGYAKLKVSRVSGVWLLEIIRVH